MHAAEPYNPYATPPVAEPVKPVKGAPFDGRGLLRFLRVWTALMVAGAPIAAAAACFEIHSIIVSGPIYAVASLTLLVFSFRHERRHFLPVAVAMLAFVTAVFVAINGLEMSPSEAQVPVSVACIAFAALFQGGWFAIAYLPAKRPADEGLSPMSGRSDAGAAASAAKGSAISGSR